MHTLHLFLYQSQAHQEWDLDNPDDIHDLYQDVTLDVQDLADWSDWFDDGPGRWADEWPRPLEYRKDQERFLEALRKVESLQREAFESQIKYLALQLDLPEADWAKWTLIGQVLFEKLAETRPARGGHTFWAARRLMEMAYGDYTPESYFYDLVNHQTSVPDEKMLDDLAKQGPLYLVPIDLHY